MGVAEKAHQTHRRSVEVLETVPLFLVSLVTQWHVRDLETSVLICFLKLK